MDELLSIFTTLWESLENILPTCPFADYIEDLTLSPYVGYLNWFIPINKYIDIATSWVTAIVAYYGVMILLRWAKIIE